MNPFIAVLPETLLSCWDALSNLLLFSCTFSQSALVHRRLGLPATEIDLAYWYKALAFAHLYIPSLVTISLLAFPCLDAQLRHQQFSPLLLRIIRSIITLLIETSLFTSSSKTDMSL